MYIYYYNYRIVCHVISPLKKYPPLYYNALYKYCILVLIIYQSYIKGVINNSHTWIHHPIYLTPPYTPPKFSHSFYTDRQEKCLQFSRNMYQIEICRPTIK